MEKEEAVVGEDRLPDEIWSAIFFYAGVKATASQICLVCKRWHQICEDEGLWKLFCHTPSYKNLLPQVQQTGTWKARCKAIRIFAPPSLWPAVILTLNQGILQKQPPAQGYQPPWNEIRNQPRYKVVFMGYCGAGKSSLMQRITKGTFNEWAEPTIGAAFAVWRGAGATLEMWDTAGSERWRALGPMYYRGATAAILVFDLSLFDERVTMEELDKWASQFFNCCDDHAQLYVVGNKSDLVDENHLKESERALKSWCASNGRGASYHIISCKTGENVHELFQAMTDSIQEHIVKDPPYTTACVAYPKDLPPPQPKCSC